MEFPEQIADLSDRILKALAASDSQTAWELRLRVNASLSQVYLALGRLMEAGRVRVTPDHLTYRVQALRPAPSLSEQDVLGANAVSGHPNG